MVQGLGFRVQGSGLKKFRVALHPKLSAVHAALTAHNQTKPQNTSPSHVPTGPSYISPPETPTARRMLKVDTKPETLTLKP